MEPEFVPEHRRPDAPGIAMNYDNTVSLYQVVEGGESFEEAAKAAFALLRKAQDMYPGWPRLSYLDVDGHSGPRSGFDEDFFEFQQEFWFSTVAHFVTAFDTPLTGPLLNPSAQRTDLPDSLDITSDDPNT